MNTIDSTHAFLTKNKIVVIFVILLGILSSLYSFLPKVDSQKKYSSTQTVQFATAPGYNPFLKLDNVAMMTYWDRDLSSIGMSLLVDPPLTVENPSGTSIPVGDGLSMVTPSNPGIIMKEATVGRLEDRVFTFDRFNQTTQIVEAEKRKFAITLQSIIDRSTKDRTLVEYTFSVVER